MKTFTPLRLAVCIQDVNAASQQAIAERIVERCKLPLVERSQAVGSYDLLVRVDHEGPGLEVLNAPEEHADLLSGHPVRFVFDAVDVRSSQGRRPDQPLFRAVGLRGKRDTPLHMIDATAGFGQDSYLLAHAGCHVTLLERQPVIACLLELAIEQCIAISPVFAARLSVIAEDAIHWLASEGVQTQPEVVYLDPMFSPGRKTRERKAMRVLRMLAGEDTDVALLWERAMRCATRRVVVKRPRKSPALDVPQKPVSTHKGKAVRYDVYAVQRSIPPAMMDSTG